MSAINTLPTEILIKCFTYLDASDLLAMLSLSSRLRLVASQDALWEPHCENLYNKGCAETSNWRKAHKSDILPSGYDFSDLPYHMIWRRMHLWEDYLGWWLSLEQEPEGIIVHVALQGDGLVISEPFPDGDIEFSAFASNWNNSQAPLFIELDSVTIGKHSNVVIQWLFKGPSGYMHHGHTLRTYRILDRASTTDLTTAFPDNQLPVYEWFSHHSPSLFAAVCHSGISVDNEGYASAIGVPSLAYPKSLRDPKPYIALRSPVELPETTSFILNGMWIASYGEVHGYEYIYIHVRQITEEDFTRPWGAEQNLGEALGPELRDFRELFGLDETHSEPELSDGDLRVGDRIIEAIKLTGDTNVPQGVRTFIGLLDHDRAWSGPRENNEFVARPVSHPWPVHPDSPTQTGMQVTALPATLTEMKRQDVPARGMTLPGLMRVAQTVFVNPKWADVVVHIAGRREIRVLMPDVRNVTVFHKIEPHMF